MSLKQRSFLANFNRVLIFALSLTGLLMDGYQNSDLPVTLALLAWLWLAVCTRVEARILGWAKIQPRSHGHESGRAETTDTI